MWSAWLYFALSIAYAVAVVAAGVVRGRPNDPYWAIAEIISVVGTLILVTLVATIHESAPPPSKVFTLMALGWTLIMARPLLSQSTSSSFEWPSLLVAVELLA
jgi:uncharacterized membrane protein YoaK (UPF0700 family)